MAGGTLNVASLDPTIDALLGKFKWFMPDGSDLLVTYNFPATAEYDYYDTTYFTEGLPPGAVPDFDFDTFFATFGPATASLEAAIDYAIEHELMAVSGLVYAKLASAEDADSSFAMAGLPTGGIGMYPGIIQRGGDAWFNVDQMRFDDVRIGDSDYWIALHELGHTVGLKHAHANDRPGPTMDVLPADKDSFEFSVMTYHHYIDAPDEPVFGDTPEGSFPQSLMMYDIAAIQYMYGANFDTNSDNTVYTFSPTTGEMSIDGVGQGTPRDNHIFRTIWDGNGVDTYDLSNYTSDLEIDLAPGGWSNFHSGQLALLSDAHDIYARANVFNALQHNDDPRSLIENATGGSGDDTIRGNSANNLLVGNDGADWLIGLEGNDRLSGGNGADILSGGVGNDVLEGGVGADELSGSSGLDFASYEHAATGIVTGLSSSALKTGEAFGDMYISVEGLIGSPFNDTLTGNSSKNELRGGAGNDVLRGEGGADHLEGGAANDILYGGTGNDTFFFARGFGSDVIVDWQDGWFSNDVISFRGQHLSMADLEISYSFWGATVSVIPSHGDQIFILGAAAGSLGADDFLF
jgi:serralysin